MNLKQERVYRTVTMKVCILEKQKLGLLTA